MNHHGGWTQGKSWTTTWVQPSMKKIPASNGY